ncbi:uncharacterized protein [Branchiostoma lanceolatum]|uniref:uncharacterized protein n=1 Tax=Branchiostoma lanceolatum TaxID=7740 RepID=UPI00345585B0
MMMSGDPVWCEQCQARGKRRQLVLYQWSSDEACYMCQDDDCTFPMGCTDMFKYTIVRNSEDLFSQRRKKRKSSLPPVTKTNHIAAPTPPIICEVSPPSLANGTFQAWKKPLPLKQGEGTKPNGASLSVQSNGGLSLDALLNRSTTPKFAPYGEVKTATTATNEKIKLPLSPIESTDIFSQGLDSKDFMSMFSENGNALIGTSCSPCDWDLDLDDIFPLGDDSVPLTQGTATSLPVLSNSLTASDTTVLKQPFEPESIAPHLFTDSALDSVVKLAENSVLGDSSTCQPSELEKAAPNLQTDSREGSFVKQAQCSASPDSSRSQPSEPENIALHSLTDSLEDSFVKQAEHSPSTDSSSSQQSEPENMALHLHTDSTGDGVVKLAQYLAVPDSSKSQGIPQATNSAIIDDLISPLIEENSTIQWTNAHSLCWLDAAMCILVHSRTLRDRLSQLNGNGESTVKTLHLAYQQAQELLANYQKARKTLSTDRRSSEARKSKSAKACRTPNSEELLCVERATEILHGVREKVFESLRPTLRCELGKNESPVFALPLLLRENSLIEDLFRMEYDWEFSCDKCGFIKSDRMTRVLPTFPSVTPDFSLLQACHLRSCFSCGAAEQKREMVFNRLPPFVMLHFVTGLSHNRLEELDCRYQDRQYRVSAVIRYKTQPDHFVAYIRDTQGNRWLQCDDLSHPVCRWQDTPPSIPPSQIHIVAWELQSNNLPSSNTLPSTSAETSTSRGSLLSDLGSSSVRSIRRNSTSSECSSLSSLQYNIDTVDLTTDVDLSGNSKNGSASSTREAATTEGTENAVRRLSGIDMQKGVVASTSPSGSSQASQQTVQTGVKQPAQFRVAAAKVQPSTAKTNVARNLFTEKPPSPPRMCLAPLPMGKALSPKSQSSQDKKLEHVSSQPNLSKAAPILRSPNSAFTVYNGCGPKKNTPTLVVPPTVNAFKPKSESTPKNPEKKTTFTADAFARQIASRAKVKEGRSKVAKPNTIRHLTQNASPSSPEIVNPSILNRFLRKPHVVAPQQMYSAVRRDVAKAAIPTNTTVSVSKGRKRALSTGTGPSKRTKVSALRNSTCTAPSSPALSTVSQKSYLQTDKQKTLTVSSWTSVSKRKISELLGNKKQFAGYQPRGMTSGTTLPEKRTKHVGQFAISNSQQALRRPQSSQKTKAISPGMQRKSAREVVKASSKVVQAMKTDLSLSNKLVTSNTSNPSQQDRGGNNVMYSYKQKGAQMKTTVEKDVPKRNISEGATSLKTACSQSNEQLTPPGNKKRLSETMSELCEKLGLPTDNVKMDSTVEDNFFDSFFDGDKSMEDFEISPSKDLLCLVADDNVNDSEFCQKLSAIGSLPTDTSKAASPAKISDSNHNRVARRVTVSTEAKDSTVALVGKLSRTLQGSPASLQRKGHFTIAQLLKHRTVQTN